MTAMIVKGFLWRAVLAFLAFIGLAIGAANCTNEADSARVLRVSGYTEVQFTGWEFGCHQDDLTCTGFIANAPNGERVRGVVGCGASGCELGTCTVRVK